MQGKKTIKRLLAELRRRNVIRATTYYLGAAWMLIGACDIFFPMLGIAESVLRIVIFVVLAGIPIVLALSWRFEFTTSGVNADTEEPQRQRIRRNPLDLLFVALLGGALTISVVLNLQQGRLFLDSQSTPLVAVSPFSDVRDTGEHISLGIAEELLNLLVRQPTIRVMSAASSFTLDQRGGDLLSAARELNADYIVRGSVTRLAEEFRLIVRLVDVATGEVVWSNDFLGGLNEIFAAQIQVAGHIAESLNIVIEYAFSSSEGQLDAQSVDLYLQAANVLRNSGSLEVIRKAQNLLEAAMLRQPDFTAGLSSLCRTYMMEFARTENPEYYNRSDAKCREALQRDPDSPHTKLALATLYNNAGEHEAARDLANEVIERLPNYEPAYTQLGLAMWREGDLAAAEEAFRAAVAIHDRNWSSQLSLGNFLARNQRYAEAIEPFTRITEIVPDDFIGYASLGVTHYEAGNFAEAKALTERSLTLNENSRAYFNLGLINAALEDHATAAEAFARAVELNPVNYRAQMFRAIALEKQGQADAAAEAKRNALTIIEGLVDVNPSDSRVLANGATILAELGESRRAVEWAERARLHNPGDPMVQYNIGVAYYTLGEQDRGIDEIVASLEMGYPRDIFVRGEMGDEILLHPRIVAALKD